MTTPVPRPPELRADCSSCFGLCCVVLPFSKESGFGVTKPGGVPCLNLADDDRCRIHATLRPDGWPGCTVFECFGAGQQVSQVTYAGVSWRDPSSPPHVLSEMGAVLSVMRHLHEMLLHLTSAERRAPGTGSALAARVTALTGGSPDDLLGLDLDALYDEVGTVLSGISATVRARWPDAVDHTRADLAGHDLRDQDLCGAMLRGAVLIAADLRGCVLADADLLGVDARDADVRGSDLARALFLTQSQVNAMRGDRETSLPTDIERPAHWQ